jgi:hypothetical protein
MEAIRLQKQIAMGMHPDTGASGKPTTNSMKSAKPSAKEKKK